jgi:hypothetical protein
VNCIFDDQIARSLYVLIPFRPRQFRGGRHRRAVPLRLDHERFTDDFLIVNFSDRIAQRLDVSQLLTDL